MAGMRVRGTAATKVRLTRIGDRTNKRLLRRVRRGAEQIRDRAREYAPVDEGDLESSIVVTEGRDGRRVSQLIGVDPKKLGEGYQKYGFRYDVRMHEDTSYKLGEKSLVKQASSGNRVGPKYLTRALADLEPVIAKDLERITREEIDS